MNDTERLNYLESLCDMGIIAFDPDAPGEMTLVWKTRVLPLRQSIDAHAERLTERLNHLRSANASALKPTESREERHEQEQH